MAELSTSSLHDLIARFQAGENGALDVLIRRTEERLALFTRRMLGDFPAVRAREQTDDVLQNALIRLTRALRQETPRSVQEFFNLAAVQIRRELLDLARSHARRPTVALTGDPPAPADDSRELDRWTALHEAIERLPPELREVFSYTFYHGWTQAQIAELLGVSDRQVRRLWIDACLRLKEAVGELPAP
ncbi:MAG TPA: sigma-70 family RNA polymerase sigma factor [Gemmataceae bacterium]|nr:sigma-70 family RNA polymerase sigma factor [Gemmataceae bacterium]